MYTCTLSMPDIYPPAGESEMGPIVKQINHPRCAELQEGDVLLEVNGERVRGYDHSDLVTVLKRCPEGNRATFLVFRQPPEVSISVQCINVSISHCA